MKHPYFDFTKYSLQEYIDMFKEFYRTDGNSFLPFNYVREDTPRIHLTLEDGSVLIIEKISFAFYPSSDKIYCPAIRYTEERNNIMLYMDGMNYTWRKGKGLVYKNMNISSTGKGLGITRSTKQKRTTVFLPDSYAFSTIKYAKYNKHILLVYKYIDGSATGQYTGYSNVLELHDKQRANGSTRESYGLVRHCTINGNKESFLEISLKQTPKKGVVEMSYGLNLDAFKKKKVLMNFPDASFEHLFNPEYMFEFELLADQESFEIIETFRTEVVSRIKGAMKPGGNCTILSTVLQNITKD